LSAHAQGIPDLRGITVLLPNYHVAQPLAQALVEQAAVPALLLPQMLTFSDWASTIELATPVESDTQRIALLYQTLRDNQWFENADLWSLSRELLALMDELTRHHVSLPDSAEAFTAQLVAAYSARNGQSLQFEARVVHELWYAMAASSQDGVRAYQQRLAQLASQINQPLYVLLTSELSAPETQFLQRCRERVEVTIFDLREQVNQVASCAAITCALQRDENQTDLRSDAQVLKKNPRARLSNPSTGSGRAGPRLSLFAAQSLEQEARAAEVQIRRWLLDEKKSIAVVVQDRLVARRVRALLERAQIQVQDETGWTFSTLSVSTVLMTWLETLQNDFYYQDVLDLLKSPFLFADARFPHPNPPREGEGTNESLRESHVNGRRQAAYRFEQMVRKQGVVSNLDRYIETNADPDLSRALVRLRQAAAVLPKNRVTLSQWLQALHNSLDILGVLPAWANDAAGQQLLQLLGQWRDELQQDTTRCSFAEWKRWLSQQLDLNTFRDMSVESPVLFTHLAATRWRSFDAVLLLGCDAHHLPAPSNNLWFNDAVRSALGLPLSSVQRDVARDDLLGLLALNDEVLVTWQTRKNGEPNLLSPHFEMLRALHVLAYDDDLAARELSEILDAANVRQTEFELPASADMPHPVVVSSLLPQRISPSGYNSLVACPYQFYARHVLRLNDLDEVREEIDKRDYGTWVHALLQRFHGEYPLLMNADREHLASELQRISKEVFADAMTHDYLALAWLLRWQAIIPAYLDSQLEREHSGWRYAAAEVPFEMTVAENLVLRGRIDRIDKRADAAETECVLDYKTQNVTALKNKLKDAGEDVQLACYAQVRNAHEAAFVSLEGEHVKTVAPAHAIVELAQLNIERLQTVFAQMRSGAALPANGVESACVYCEMRGLCRQGSWESI
jgi:ATP-dependent helicase/nuclease subunit B